MAKVPDNKSVSSRWEMENVIETLRQQSNVDQPPTAQVFLDESVEVDTKSFPDLAQQILDTASAKLGKSVGIKKIGKLHLLAKSFSVTADPDVFAEISKSPSVKSILPSEISDIYPKPVDFD